MSNEITLRGKAAMLPAATQTLMREWRESPRKSYDSLPEVISHEEIIKSPSPTLSQISRFVDETQALAVISMAIDDVNYLFRKDRRMDERDIVVTARAILRRYWYLKPEDIKKCFNGPRPKQFVLEGDSFLSWLAEYDLKRDNACESMKSDPEEVSASEGAVTFEEWCKTRPKEGNFLAYGRTGRPPLTKEEKEKKEADFQRFRRDYLMRKGIKPQQ